MKVLSLLSLDSFDGIAGIGRIRQGLKLLAAGLTVSFASGCGVLFSGANPPAGGGTEFSGTAGACAVSLYDADFAYGFDLPSDAELVRFDNEQDARANSLWTLTVGDVLINITARVQGDSGGATLAEIVQSADNDALIAGADLLLEESVTLANGGEAFHTIVRFDGLTTSRVQTLTNSSLYTVESIIVTDSRTDALDTLISAIVLSLCVD